MPARDALMMQALMRQEMTKGGTMDAYLDGFEESQRGIDTDRENPAVPNAIGLFAPLSKGGRKYEPGALGDYFRALLEQALAFYVDAKMTPLVTAAAETMPDEPLRPEDLPNTHGFMLIPGGLTQIDVRGRILVANVAVWAVRSGGVDLWLLSDKNDERDSVNVIYAKRHGSVLGLPLLSPMQYVRLSFGTPLPKALGARKVLPPEMSEQIRIFETPGGELAMYWPEGMSREEMKEWMEGAMEARTDPSTQWIVTVWRLMQQTLADVREEKMDRRAQRVARKIRLRNDTVTVITLRRRKGRVGEGDAEIEWSHRFWRRGHWRMAWVGTGTAKYQRAVYIHPTVVNKDRVDLPFLEREHVYNLAR